MAHLHLHESTQFATLPGSTTAAAREAREVGVDDAPHDPFGDVPAQLRRELARAAAAAGSSDEALHAVVALLVPGSQARIDAVAQAMTANDRLRDQWLRTYELLCSEAT